MSQLVQDRFHFICGEYVLDQDTTFDSTEDESQALLAPREHIVPEPCFTGTLNFGQVKVRAASAFRHQTAVVVRQNSKVK